MWRFRGVVAAAAAAIVLVPAAGGAPSVTPQEQQFVLAAGPAAKILVKTEGWYTVTRAKLLAAGLDPAKSTKFLQLFTDGVEVPMKASKTGVEFYGLPVDTRSADTRSYWLVRGKTAGKRIKVVDAKKVRGPLSSSFASVLELKERKTYLSALKNGEADNFYGTVVFPGKTATQTLKLTNLAPGTSSLNVSVFGLSLRPHRVRVTLNGTALGELTMTAQTAASEKFSVPDGLLKEGDNTLTFVTLAGELDFALTDTTQLTYPRRFFAQRNQLLVTARAGAPVRVQGFTNSRLRVVDVTKSAEPIELKPLVKKTGPTWTASVSATLRNRQLLFFTTGVAKKPAAVQKDAASTLNRATNQADLVIVSHGAFIPALAPLVALRESQGFKTMVVDVENVYDEFAFGVHGPDGIKAFLAWAVSHWQKPPRFALLVGDATYDPRNYMDKGDFDFIPTKLLDTVYLETASDDWLADFNDDGAPEIAVGRLPVRTPDQTATVVGKLVRYDQAPPNRRSALLVSDHFQDYDFEAANRSLQRLIPTTWSVTHVKRAEGPNDAAVKTRLFDFLNRGPTLVNFYGHGSLDIWTGGSILKNTDPARLTNRDSLSLYVAMTCLNGYFLEPAYDALGEALLTSPGGAIAVWSSTGETGLSGQLVMDEKATGEILSNPNVTLGEAMSRAKAIVNDIDVRHTWVLFGDPTTKLH